ncbi:MAG: cbb3-type cytochrome oxidase assembly protein [Saprospiraceae bacterium]|nr:cbb3-type cytochrome oxidase assembly protein [Saprospiraceae bacterium]
MKIIILLLGVSLCVALFLLPFCVSVNDGQYDEIWSSREEYFLKQKKTLRK